MTAVKTHQPCPDCGSKDALAIYEDHTFCFSCSTWSKIVLDKSQNSCENILKKDNKKTTYSNNKGYDTLMINNNIKHNHSNTNSYNLQYISWRGVTSETMKAYGVQCRVDNNNGQPHSFVFPYGEGASKIRLADKKDFFAEGSMKDAPLFGQDKFSPAQGMSVTITEGELDALSVYQMLGSKYPCVSVRGASSARSDCERAFKWLNSFDKIYLCFDNDEPGQKACKEVSSLFDINKVYHVEMGGGNKDANDYLQKGETKAFTNVWWNAKTFRPKNVIAEYSQIEDVLRSTKGGAIAEYPFQTLQSITYGIRSSELVLFTAQEKVGKGLWVGTPVPTNDGWSTIGELKVGDLILGSDGKPTKVTFITPEQNLDCYEVWFSDGTHLLTDGPHRWSVRDLNNKVMIKNTEEMFKEGVIAKGSKAKFRVPSMKPMEGRSDDLPVDPFLLGAWLADGHSYSDHISVPPHKKHFYDLYKQTKVHEYEGKCPSISFAELTHKELNTLGLLKNKHIPSVFMRANHYTRQKLFNGLMLDGWNEKEYYSSNERLFFQFVELARSLGYHVTTRSRMGKYNGKETKQAWSARFRKDDWKSIRSIRKVTSVPTRCLQVDALDHLFVVGEGWVVTHNTEVLRAIEYHLLKNTDYNIGILHLEEEEKRSVQGLVGYELNLPVHLPDCNVSIDDQLSTYKTITKHDGRLHFYKHFGSDDPDIILDTIRYLVGVCHCKFIFLDHITMLVTGYEDEDERKKLDYISTRLAMLTRELDFTLFLISHVNDNGQTRGSRNISKVADLIVHLERNTEAETFDERNKTHLLVRGNRFAGTSGPAGVLWFDNKTFKLSELTEEQAQVNSVPF